MLDLNKYHNFDELITNQEIINYIINPTKNYYLFESTTVNNLSYQIQDLV